MRMIAPPPYESQWALIFMALLGALFGVMGLGFAQNMLVNGGFEAPALVSGEATRPGISEWGVVGTAYTAQGVTGQPDAQEGSQYLLGDTADFHVFQDAGQFTPGAYYVLKAWVYPTASLSDVEIHAVLEETETWSGYQAAMFYHPFWATQQEDFTLTRDSGHESSYLSQQTVIPRLSERLSVSGFSAVILPWMGLRSLFPVPVRPKPFT